MRKNFRAAAAVGFVVASFTASCCLQAIGQQLIGPAPWSAGSSSGSHVQRTLFKSKTDSVQNSAALSGAQPGIQHDYTNRQPTPVDFGAVGCGTIAPQSFYDESTVASQSASSSTASKSGLWTNLDQFRGKVSQQTVDFLAHLQQRATSDSTK